MLSATFAMRPNVSNWICGFRYGKSKQKIVAKLPTDDGYMQFAE